MAPKETTKKILTGLSQEIKPEEQKALGREALLEVSQVETMRSVFENRLDITSSFKNAQAKKAASPDSRIEYKGDEKKLLNDVNAALMQGLFAKSAGKSEAPKAAAESKVTPKTPGQSG